MPLVTNAEYSDITYVYGFCNGNRGAAAQEYRRQRLFFLIPRMMKSYCTLD